MITPEQALKIKAGLEAEKTLVVVAKEVGVAKSTVERVRRVFLKKGKFNEFLEKAEHMASLEHRGGARPASGRVKGSKNVSDKIIANMKHLRGQGLSGREIAKRLGVGQSMVFYWTSGPGSKKHIGEPAVRHGKQEKLRERILALKEKGFTIKEVAEKLDIPTGTVSYRLYGDKKSKETTPPKELNNGDSSNGTSGLFNKHVRLGIAFAETERFIGVLSERLSVPTKVLRSGLSELLGHSPLRDSPGSGD